MNFSEDRDVDKGYSIPPLKRETHTNTTTQSRTQTETNNLPKYDFWSNNYCGGVEAKRQLVR